MNEKRLFNIEYSALFGVYMVVYAVVQGFALVFLQERGYTNTEIGWIFGGSNIAALLIQPGLAAISDHSRKLTMARVLILIGVISAVLALIIIMVPRRGWLLSAAYTMLVGFVFSKQPFCNSMAADFARKGHVIDFGIARGIGSLFYAVTVSIMGSVVVLAGVGTIPAVAVAGLVIFCILAAVMSRQLGTEKYTRIKGSSKGGMLDIFRRYKRFALFNAGIVGMLFTHCMVSNFMMNIVAQFGGDSGDMGRLTGVIAMTEMVGMVVFHRLLRRFNCSTLLKFACIMFTVKELLYTLSWNMPMLYVTALTQGLSYGIFIPGSVRYVDELVAPEDAVMGQTCVTSLITLGALLSSFVGGVLFDAVGVSATLIAGVAVSAVGTVLALPGIEKVR